MPDEFQYDVFLSHSAKDKAVVLSSTLSASTGERVGVRCRSPQQAAFFSYLGPEAREILDDLLEKYASDGELQFTLPDVLKLPPISHHGNVNEIIGKFGGADQLRTAVNQLQSLLYAPSADGAA